jgi:hypothetical protein
LGAAGALALGGLAALPVARGAGGVRAGLRAALVLGAALSGLAGVAGEAYLRASRGRPPSRGDFSDVH